LNDALRFAESRTEWIAAQLRRLPQGLALAPGVVIEVDGAPCRLERAAMRVKARVVPPTDDEPARLVASGDGDAYERAVVRALKAQALLRVTERTALYVQALAQPMPEVAVMDARMRWGSCTPAYWTVVKRIFGDHRPSRAWLRAHGAALHAIGA
jgi:predicted metal-dependent hydrolase